MMIQHGRMILYLYNERADQSDSRQFLYFIFISVTIKISRLQWLLTILSLFLTKFDKIKSSSVSSVWPLGQEV